MIEINFSGNPKIFSILKKASYILYKTFPSLWSPTIMSWSLFQLLDFWFWHLNNICPINVDLKPVLSLLLKFALTVVLTCFCMCDFTHLDTNIFQFTLFSFWSKPKLNENIYVASFINNPSRKLFGLKFLFYSSLRPLPNFDVCMSDTLG